MKPALIIVDLKTNKKFVVFACKAGDPEVVLTTMAKAQQELNTTHQCSSLVVKTALGDLAPSQRNTVYVIGESIPSTRDLTRAELIQQCLIKTFWEELIKEQETELTKLNETSERNLYPGERKSVEGKIQSTKSMIKDFQKYLAERNTDKILTEVVSLKKSERIFYKINIIEEP